VYSRSDTRINSIKYHPRSTASGRPEWQSINIPLDTPQI